MTLNVALNLFLQSGSTPVWVPLAILLVVILIFWWGLTRNKISEEEGSASSEDEEVEASAAELAEVEEAEELEEAAEEEVAEAAEEDAAEAELPVEPDDLKLIEGVGPKISSILMEAGITTFAQLADTSLDELERIVHDEAGIHIANPESWPAQAALAAAGDSEGLAALQDKLIAGRLDDD